jgi:type VI secretion system protein ImpL
MVLRYAATAAGLVAYLMLDWFLASFLGLQGADLWLFRIGLALIGLMVAATCAWYIRRRQQEPQQVESTPASNRSSAGKVDSRLRDAALALKERRLKPLSRLPVLLVLGEPASGKTTTVVKSGMRPELLAGKDYSGSDVVATESLNCWLLEGAIVIEPALSVQSVPSEWGSLTKRVTLRRLSGAPGPLAVLVCFPADGLGGSRDSVIAAGRKLRAQLGSLAQAAERRIPIYVVFTKLDLLKAFPEYIARFADSEIDQPLGAPMPMAADGNRAMHSDRISQTVASRFDGLVAGLARTRIDLLQRQREMKGDNDPKTLAAIYEFPREFKRIRDNTVQFLTELCIPGATSFGPFLRGFYFCGARPVPGRQPVVESSSRDLSATVIVRSPSIEGRSMFSSSFRGGSASDQQWTFLGPVFDEILHDKQAAESSRSDVGMSVRRKVLLGIAGVLVLSLFVGMTVSFLKNHDLITRVKNAADAVNAPGSNSAAQMGALDSLATEIQRLDGYSESGVPWSLRWGLYAGNKARESGEKVYFYWFNRLLMNDVQSGINRSVEGVSPTLVLSGSDESYNALKAYLMLTSEKSDRDRVDPDFLASYLLRRWSGAHPSSSDVDRDFAKRQFEFFAAKLKSEVSLAKTRNDAIVERARTYLGSSETGGRLYKEMLEEARKSGSRVEFVNTDVLTSPHVVAAEYTKAGWKVMNNALQNPQRFSTRDQWVFGAAPGKQMSLSEAETLRQTYVQEYISQWRMFVKRAQIRKFDNLGDAATKLRMLAEPSSPLLKFLFVASDNTNLDSPESPEVKLAFLAVQSFVKPDSPNNYVGGANMEYMNALLQLRVLVEKMTTSAPGVPISPSDLDQAIAAAYAARTKALEAGQKLGNDPVAQLQKTVLDLLEAPIRMTDELLQKEKLKAPK